MKDSKIDISFVSPVFNSEKIIGELISEIQKVMITIDKTYEIILVDDRSTDNSWKEMEKLCSNISNLKIIRLSRNFGQYPATMAGLSYSKGIWTVVLDCDLQDQPKEVIKLYRKANEGFDAVLAKRKNRKDNFIKRFSSYSFAKIYNYLTDTKHDYQVANFGIYHRKVVSAILSMSDHHVHLPLFVEFVGFNRTSVEVEHGSRLEGETSYSYAKLFELALNSIVSFSNKPLKLMIRFGLTISIVSLFFGLYNLYLSITDQITVLGYSSLIISIWFLSGIIMTLIGICGMYIGRIFDQTKNRPRYFVDVVK